MTPATRSLLAAMTLAMSSLPLHAAVFEVTNNADSGAGSLRAAITALNAHPSPNDQHDIVFRLPAGQETILVQTTLPVIDRTFVRLQGQPILNPGARPILRRSTTVGPLIRLGSSVQEAELSAMDLGQGFPCVDASALNANADLLLDGLVLRGCVGSGPSGSETAGAAMRLRGQVIISNTLFEGNALELSTGPGVLLGADIALLSGELDVLDSQFRSARLTLGSNPIGVACLGGSLHAAAGTRARILRSEFQDSIVECGIGSAGGAIAAQGHLSLDRVRLRQNIASVGGAVWYGPILDATATLRLQNTLLLDNQAWDYLSPDPDGLGGGLFVRAQSGASTRVEIRNTTFALNRARSGVGAHLADSGADYRTFHSTLFGQSGPSQSGLTGSACDLDASSVIPSAPSRSLAVDASCATFSGLAQVDATTLGLQILQPANSPPVDIALRDDSPAIDAGADGAPSTSDFSRCAPLDLDGRARPLDGDADGNAACDIGAIESPGNLLFANGFEA